MNQTFLSLANSNPEIRKLLMTWNIGEELAEDSPKLNYYIKYYIILKMRGKVSRHFEGEFKSVD